MVLGTFKIMLEYAEIIVEEFEKNVRCACDVNDYTEDAEEILLYLACKKYIERYG